MCRGQLPIKSHFSEERTLKRVGIYLISPPFSPHDQLYVAFFQTSWFDNVAIAIAEGHRQRIGSERLISPDIVYREVL